MENIRIDQNSNVTKLMKTIQSTESLHIYLLKRTDFSPTFMNATSVCLRLLVTSGIWTATLTLLQEYADKYGRIHVTVGPLFDYNGDGLRDRWTDITRSRFTFSASGHISATLASHQWCPQTLALDDLLGQQLPIFMSPKLPVSS